MFLNPYPPLRSPYRSSRDFAHSLSQRRFTAPRPPPSDDDDRPRRAAENGARAAVMLQEANTIDPVAQSAFITKAYFAAQGLEWPPPKREASYVNASGGTLVDPTAKFVCRCYDAALEGA